MEGKNEIERKLYKNTDERRRKRCRTVIYLLYFFSISFLLIISIYFFLLARLENSRVGGLNISTKNYFKTKNEH